ncbi:cytochrome P450 [Jatrophihabitans sp. GAS493]|uniref:cytochrome P450 n=1 Tax=Jatrophihabitans sp. GAS493 TaxID=1907575 RepID=UPI000BBFC194|nr:cytochrome P450 [Jatrophihabitans sp. GAS493]SOD75058.1 cytochrome P450 [Jatrophihabitans sp. GAS493]
MTVEPFGELAVALSDSAVRAVFADPRFSRSATFTGGGTTLNAGMGQWGASGMDGPEHLAIRRGLSAGATAEVLVAKRQEFEDLADRLIATVCSGDGHFELNAAIAEPFAVQCLGIILGTDLGDPRRLRRAVDATVAIEGAEAEELEHAVRTLTMVCLRAAAGGAAGQNGDGLIPRMLQQLGDDRATRRLIAHNVLPYVVGGIENPFVAIGASLIGLLESAEARTTVRAEPERVAAVVDELLRLHPTGLMSFARAPMEDVELAGVTIAAGTPVVPMIGPANRDPVRYENPDTFSLARPPSRHLSFGWGPHFCVGEQLGRLQLELLLPRLVRRLPGLRLSVQRSELVKRTGHIVDGYDPIPLAWGR